MSLFRVHLLRHWQKCTSWTSSGPADCNRRQLHVTDRRQGIEVLAALGIGFYTQSQWLVLPGYVKTAAVTVPLLATGFLAKYKLGRTAHDPLLQRSKFLSKRYDHAKVPKVTYLDGPAVGKANELLHQLVHVNKEWIPGLSHHTRNWQVLFSKDLSMWVDCAENGTLLCPKDMVETLSRNELVMLFSTQVAHVLAQHRTEYVSFRTMTRLVAAIAAWYYAFFFPVLCSYPVDIGALLLSYFLLSHRLFQLKFRKLCLEADELGLAMASKMGVTEHDAISLMEKMIRVREQLPLTSRMRAWCYYEYRISTMRKNMAERDRINALSSSRQGKS